MDGNVIYKSRFLPPLGEKTTTYWCNDNLVGLSLGETAGDTLERKLMGYCGAAAVIDCSDREQTPIMQQFVRELTAYYAGEEAAFTVPITLYGTEFQKKIWTALLEVPYGHTCTYSELAGAAGVRGNRACGSAVGSNPIAIVVPCHRILPKSGKIGNYSSGRGSETKRELLTLEAKSNQEGAVYWK